MTLWQDWISLTNDALRVIQVFLEPLVGGASNKAAMELAIVTRHRLVLCREDTYQSCVHFTWQPSVLHQCPTIVGSFATLSMPWVQHHLPVSKPLGYNWPLLKWHSCMSVFPKLATSQKLLSVQHFILNPSQILATLGTVQKWGSYQYECQVSLLDCKVPQWSWCLSLGP